MTSDNTAATTTRTPLSALELQVVSFIEQIWFARGKFPSASELQVKFPDFDLAAQPSDTFLLALSNRGISPPVGGFKSAAAEDPYGLSANQIAAIATVVNFADKRSRMAKLRDMGLSPTIWNGWMQDEAFVKYLHNLAAKNFHNSVDEVQEGLVKAAANGDTGAAKFFLELTGRYSPNSATEQNIKVILARVVESIQRHVKDQTVITAIAKDFEAILEGRPIVVPKEINV